VVGVKIVGVDLAGKPENPTGYSVLTEIGDKKHVESRILYSDQDITSSIESDKPDLVAIDAPLIYEGENRLCDEKLSRYGALPVTLPGMTYLANRGNRLAEKIGEKNFDYIEVHPTSSAKILGVYSKDNFQFQKNIMKLDLDGDFTSRIMSRDELDSLIAAMTGYLHLSDETTSVGDDSGRIIIPEI